MSETNGEARSARTAAGVVLGGLAVGAILGAASPAQAATETSTAAAAATVSVRDQIAGAFTAGAITTSAHSAPAIICDPV